MRKFCKHLGLKVAAGVIAIAAAVGAIALPAQAETQTVSITKEQSGAVSQNCSTIRQSLKTLQRADARTRSYLGIVYEDFLNDFITPLDIRLVKSGQPSSAITDLHSSVISARQDFNHKFTTYSQSLEELINVDCTKRPEDFYVQLASTRQQRADLAKATNKLHDLLQKYSEAVKKLKEAM